MSPQFSNLDFPPLLLSVNIYFHPLKTEHNRGQSVIEKFSTGFPEVAKKVKKKSKNLFLPCSTPIKILFGFAPVPSLFLDKSIEI